MCLYWVFVGCTWLKFVQAQWTYFLTLSLGQCCNKPNEFTIMMLISVAYLQILRLC